MSPERYSRGFERHIRDTKAEFRHTQDVNSYPAIREYLKEVVPYYDDVYSRYDHIFEDWHKVRLEIAKLDINDKDYLKKAREAGTRFVNKYENPKSADYVEDLLVRLKPVLTQITNLVIANKNTIA